MLHPLPKAFAYLASEPGPKILHAALKDYGLCELPGTANSPRILQMARNVGAHTYYKNDATPWCALQMADWVKQAGFALPFDPLAAKNWALFGTEVPLKEAILGDILVMARPGGNHVTMYVGEEKRQTYYGLGGNQGNMTCIAPFPIERITHVRRCPWKILQPATLDKRYPGRADVMPSKSEA